MNDSKNNPKSFPPDDFSATTPNIKIPKQDLPDYSSEPANDWEKTNYNYSPKDLGTDQWNKPAYNTPPQPQNAPNNYNQPYQPSQPPPAANAPKEADWGMTQANIKLPSNQPVDNSQTRQGNFGGGQQQAEYGATTPFIRLPENERQKYQNLPPTPAQAQAEAKQEEKKGGIPSWVWVAGGLLALFLFAIVIIAGVYFLYLNKRGFDVVIKGAPDATRSVLVSGSPWDITTADGNYKLRGLKAGETKKIEINAPGWTCEGFDVVGGDGEQVEKLAQCKQIAKISTPTNKPGCDPSTFTKGDIPKSHACANEKLDALTENFTVQELLDAMNLYIIQFASGKFNINPEDMKFLEKSSVYMKKLPPNVSIEVGGHTDNTGKNNQKLSEDRANAVRSALVGFGVKPEILLMRGYAETRPKDSNATEDGKFRNRRIEYSAIMR